VPAWATLALITWQSTDGTTAPGKCGAGPSGARKRRRVVLCALEPLLFASLGTGSAGPAGPHDGEPLLQHFL
jgi:hypothetical protein